MTDDRLDALAETAGALSEAFSDAASSIADSLSDAARSGGFAFEEMSRSITRSLASIAVDRLLRQPLEALAASAADRLGAAVQGAIGTGIAGVIGARATGGPVSPGASYLVGERGPELLTPLAAGRVTPLQGQTVVVNVAMSGDENGMRRTARQAARALAREVRRGLEPR